MRSPPASTTAAANFSPLSAAASNIASTIACASFSPSFSAILKLPPSFGWSQSSFVRVWLRIRSAGNISRGPPRSTDTSRLHSGGTAATMNSLACKRGGKHGGTKSRGGRHRQRLRRLGLGGAHRRGGCSGHPAGARTLVGYRPDPLDEYRAPHGLSARLAAL